MTDMQSLLAGSQDQIFTYKAGQTVKGSVIDATPSRILLDLHNGRTGIITRKEATGYGVGNLEAEPGTDIEAFIIDPENDLGLVVLSLRRASQEMVWAELHDCLENERIIKVKITEANKGGLMTQYKGVKAFLPVSQLTPMNYPRVDGADTGEILRRLEEHVGKEFVVRVITADRENGKLIVSEKAAHKDQRRETLKNLRVGDIVKGQVSGVVKFGIFVTFGGAEGLVHLSEMDWSHVSNPGKMYDIGEKVEVLVLAVDGDKLSLSIKRLTEDPWKEKVEVYHEGQEVTGKVSRWNSHGVFVDIAPEVQGVFSLDQFGVADYSELKLSEGEPMTGTIQSIDYEGHRLVLLRSDLEAELKETTEEAAPKKEEKETKKKDSSAKKESSEEQEDSDKDETKEKKNTAKKSTAKTKKTTTKSSSKKEEKEEDTADEK